MDASAPQFSWKGAVRNATPWIEVFLCLGVAVLAARESRTVLGEYAPFLTAAPVIAFAAWRCGLGPSLLSILVVLIAAKYWFIEPFGSWRLDSATEIIPFLIFVVVGGLIVAIGEVNRREKQRLVESRGELEDRVRARTQQLDVANEGLSNLTARLLQLQDDERRHLARDLHDSLGQTMAVLEINLKNIEAEIERLKKTIGMVKDSQEMVRETSTSIRTISYLLHPPMLDENGLSLALPWFIEGFSQRSGIKVELDCPVDLGRLSRDSEIAIFRVVQECLTNIHRHSGAASAQIRVGRKGDNIVVVVEDDGRGLLPEKLYEMASGGTPGIGIRGMRERIRQLGGSLEIHSHGLDKGTTVVTRLPYLPYIPSSLSDAQGSSGQVTTH